MTLALEVNAPGFSLAAEVPTLEINPGDSGTTTIAVTDYAGFTGVVTLAVTSALPSGVSASFVTNPTANTSALVLSASSATAPVRSMVTITGTSGNISSSTTFALVINEPIFLLNLSPYPYTLVRGQSVTSTVTVTPEGSFTGSVALSATGLAPGVTASFSPASTTGTSLLTMTASSTATLGASEPMVIGTATGVTSYSPFQQNIVASASPTFSVAVSPAMINLAQGSSAADTITITPLNGYTGNAMLSVQGLPIGVSASFSPNSTQSTSVLTLTASNTAYVGTAFLLTIDAASSSGYSIQAVVDLNVLPSQSFNLSSSQPSLQMFQGSSVQDTVTVTPQSGFLGKVSLAASGLPGGVTAAFGTSTSSGSSVLTLTASNSVAAGTYYVNVTGTYGSLSQTICIPFTIAAAAGTTTTLSIVPNSTYAVSGSATSAWLLDLHYVIKKEQFACLVDREVAT